MIETLTVCQNPWNLQENQLLDFFGTYSYKIKSYEFFGN